MNKIVAGLIAALPLSIVGAAYMALKGQHFVSVLQNSTKGDNPMTTQQWTVLMFAALTLAPFILGIAAGVVYGWVGKPLPFLALAGGLALLFSILALAGRTPLALEKVVMNFLVALAFGVLLPWLVGR